MRQSVRTWRRLSSFGSGAFAVVVLLIACASITDAIGEVIYAVNSGGGAHVDSFGVHYQKDMLGVGFASDHGKNIGIRRVPTQDQILYQTERYHTQNFAYSVPIKTDGEYVLVLKFSEVWFNAPNQKVFSVVLNDRHTVVDHLDIFKVAGLGVAHDEIVPFSIRNGQLQVGGELSKFESSLKIEFVKLDHDNPKINALFVMKGKFEDVPQLPPLPRMDRPPDMLDDEEDEEEQKSASKPAAEKRRRSNVAEPRVADPYATEDPTSMMLPLVIAVGAFIPLVFCLCRL